MVISEIIQEEFIDINLEVNFWEVMRLRLLDGVLKRMEVNIGLCKIHGEKIGEKMVFSGSLWEKLVLMTEL